MFYPEGFRERNAWHLTLHGTEIEDIGDGLMQEIVLSSCTSPDCQCKFREEDEHCFYCDYFDDPNFGEFDFPEADEKLIQHGVTGIHENSSRENVIAILGTPDSAGGDIEEAVLGYIYPWINYLRGDCQLRFEFDKECKRITNVTVQEKDYQPDQ